MPASPAPFPYRTPPELAGGPGRRPDVIVVGAGPVGLAAAIDLAMHGVSVLLLDDSDRVAVGSRAICWAKRTLEIFDRLGVGETVAEKGVQWQVGRVFHRDREIWRFDLLPEAGHKMPAFVNLPQDQLEHALVRRAGELSGIDLRWRNRVLAVDQTQDGVRATVETPDGTYAIEADWLVAADGACSPVRAMLGLGFVGQAFEERFLIADVRVDEEMPAERRFWFAPVFHPGQSALVHKQPENVYRIDLQLGPDADPEAEKRPERVRPRIEAALGHGRFDLDWVSVYAFQCRRLARFVHDRVIFAGDSAHVVSPFGARGGNGGIHDADNLAWKLALVAKGKAPRRLLDSYDEERGRGADENIRHSARATAFLTPKTEAERRYRDGVLALSAEHDFARRMVNSGRLSSPCALDGLSLQTPDAEPIEGGVRPGEALPDAPLGDGWLLERVGGRFLLLDTGTDTEVATAIGAGMPLLRLGHDVDDPTGLLVGRLGKGLLYLVRPDQHIAARWRHPTPAPVERALARASGHSDA